MKRLEWALLVFVAGAILPAHRLALAQATVAGPAAAASSGASGAESPPGVDAKTSAASTPNSGGGYTWREKSHGKHRKGTATKVNPKLAQEKGPEFAVVGDGTTRITVQLSKKVEFKTEALHRRIVVNLDQAQVAILNDRNPLVTTHFSTPVEDARLVQHKSSVRLVVDLKANVTPQVTLKDTSAGPTILEVVLPKWSEPNRTRSNSSPKYRAKVDASRKSKASAANVREPGL